MDFAKVEVEEGAESTDGGGSYGNSLSCVN